jgi:hypothetical protein
MTPQSQGRESVNAEFVVYKRSTEAAFLREWASVFIPDAAYGLSPLAVFPFFVFRLHLSLIILAPFCRCSRVPLLSWWLNFQLEIYCLTVGIEERSYEYQNADCP